MFLFLLRVAKAPAGAIAAAAAAPAFALLPVADTSADNGEKQDGDAQCAEYCGKIHEKPPYLLPVGEAAATALMVR